MKRLVLFLLIALSSHWVAAKPVELALWHSFAGHTGEELNQIIHEFNVSQSGYVIQPTYKGEYTDLLTSFAAAFRAKQPPDIVQVFEVGTAVMLAPQGIIKPLYVLLKEEGVSIPIRLFFPAIRDFYSLANELQAMPFNSSVPVIFYNKNAFKAAGITEFPRTWQAMEQAAAQLQKAGIPCAYTSAYSGWIHIESFSALHNLVFIDKTVHKAMYDNPAIIHHLERLRQWQVKHYFEYGGRANDATMLFTSGHCAMFSQSSGALKSLALTTPFPIGVGLMPLDLSISTVRYRNTIGGAALWAVAARPKNHYRGIALFYEYLAKASVQSRWHLNTGYIPLGLTEDYASLSTPNLALLLPDLTNSRVTSQGNPYGIPQNQIRIINDEALEAIFSGIKPPREAMTEAVRRADLALNRFLRNTGI